MTDLVVALVIAAVVVALAARAGLPLGRVGTWLLAVVGITIWCATGVAMVLIACTGTAPG